MRLFSSHYKTIFIVQTLDRLQGWVIRTQGIFYMPVERGCLYFLHRDTLGGMETADLPQLLRSQLCHHGGICLVVSCHPCQPPCKGIMSGVWIFMDLGSDFQTPGLPCSGGEQHVLVPEVAELCLDNLVWSSSDFPMCEHADKHFHSSSWYFPDFVMSGIGYEIPISCHGTHSCVHSHAAGAGDTWARL